MELVKVKLIAKRDGLLGGHIEKVIEVERQKNDLETRMFAELIFCNEYINRDIVIGNFNSLSAAKKFAKITVTSTLNLT